MKYFRDGALGFVCISTFKSSIDAHLQRFFNEYFVDTDLDYVEFEGFTPDIRARPVYLINSGRDQQIASDSESDSHIVIGLPTGLTMIPSIVIPFDIHQQE